MRRLWIYILAMSCFSIAGCNDQYWRRSDSIYLQHGDAVRSNMAVQIPDPWPKGSDNTNIPMDPVKARNAIECYRLGQKTADPLGSVTMGYKSTAGGGGGGGSGGSACQSAGGQATGGDMSQEAQ